MNNLTQNSYLLTLADDLILLYDYVFIIERYYIEDIVDQLGISRK